MNTLIKRRHHFLIIISALFISLGVTVAPAQEIQTSTTCQRKEYNMLKSLVGNWVVQWTFRKEPGKFINTVANSHFEKDSIGCMITEHFYGILEGKQFAIFSLLNFTGADELQKIYLDSGHGQVLLFTGTQDKDIVRFLWEKKSGNKTLLLKNELKISFRRVSNQ